MRSERIEVLDVLRGVALLGMFLVHFNENATAGAGAGAVYQRIVALFFEERFWTMFGILFGVGFAVQLRRAEERGGSFAPAYIRRLIALAAFGFFAHAVLGFKKFQKSVAGRFSHNQPQKVLALVSRLDELPSAAELARNLSAT